MRHLVCGMLKHAISLVCGAAFAATTFAPSSAAQVINLSTGLRNGIPLAAGVIDSTWLTLHAGEITFYNRVVSDGVNAGCGCGIIPNAPTGQWINISGLANSGWLVGAVNETFRSFDLSKYNLATVTISGEWAAMDNNLGLYLNGVLIPGTTIAAAATPWTSLHSFSITGANNFRSGFNELSFHSTTTSGFYDGVLLRNGFVVGTVVPEPNALALLAVGLAGIGIALYLKPRRSLTGSLL